MKKQKNYSVIALCLPSLVMLMPLLFMLSGVLTGQGELARSIGAAFTGEEYAVWRILPQFPSFSAILELLLDTPEFFVMFWNSVTICFAQCAGQVIFASGAAWALSRLRFRFRKVFLALYIVLMLLPFQVMMVPQYLALSRLSLLDTRLAVILPGVFSAFPVFIMVKSFDSVPRALLEAASIDGAGHIKTFLRIGIPLGVPGILSAVVLGFLESWNAVEQPMAFIKNSALWPLALYMPSADYRALAIAMASGFLTLLPCVLLFRFGQSYLELGIQASGIKE